MAKAKFFYALLVWVMVVSCPHTVGGAETTEPCTFMAAGDSCIFDVQAAGRGRFEVSTKANVQGQRWRAILVEVGRKHAESAIGTGSTTQFTSPVGTHVSTGERYEVVVIFEHPLGGPLPDPFPPTSMTLRFDGPITVSRRSGGSGGSPPEPPAETWTTSLFAGTPQSPGFVDGIGVAAQFGTAGDLAVDSTVLWVIDTVNHSVRRIDIATAAVVTVAGTNTPGLVDNPIGLNARFNNPFSIATDGTTVWIADTGNRVLRAMTAVAPHTVTTVAGSGAQQVVDGVGLNAAFDDIRGLAYHDGFVYLLDATAAVLRRFDPSTGQVTTIAGTPYVLGRVDGAGAAASFISPRNMVADNGLLYISDTNGSQIRTYTIASGEVGTFAGSGVQGYVDGTGTTALLHRPRGVTSDGVSIYFVEFNQHTVRRGHISSASVGTVLGTHCGGAFPCAGGYVEGTGTAALFNLPFAIGFHPGSDSLFIFDGGNAVIRRATR